MRIPQSTGWQSGLLTIQRVSDFLMKKIKILGKKKPVWAAEWKDAEKIVERIVKEERGFLARLANL